MSLFLDPEWVKRMAEKENGLEVGAGMMTPTFTIEPGDGTGSSIVDAQVRNKQGVCSILGCGKKLAEDAVPYEGRGLMYKLCPECEKENRAIFQDMITELTEGFQHHGRVLDDMEDHSELPRDEQSSPNG